MPKIGTIIILAVLVIGLSGCAGALHDLCLGSVENQNLYSGPPRPVEQVARIKRGNIIWRGPTYANDIQWVIELNGAPVPGSLPSRWQCVTHREITLLPGYHRIVVMYDFKEIVFLGPLLGKPPIHSNTYHSLIAFDAKAGHRYVPHSRCEGVNTPKEKCEAWLADDETGKIVARGTPVSIGDPLKRPPWREQNPEQGPKEQNQETDGQGS